MTEPKVHIVGHAVVIAERHCRQLCAWCGERLVDEDLSLIATPDGQGFNPFWDQNALLEVGENYKMIVKPTEDGKLPPGCCANKPTLRLVPRSGAAEQLEQQTRCDHKFVDSKHCLKCGWTPPERGRLA